MAEVSKDDMIVYNGARYRYEDARRLGIPMSGGIVTARSVERPPRTTAASEGTFLVTSEAQGASTVEDETPVEGDEGSESAETASKEKPKRSASKDAWVAYAVAHGHAEADLTGLKRDEIAEMFPDENVED